MCEAKLGGNGWSDLELTSAAVFWNSATAEPCSGQLLAPAQGDLLLQPVEEGGRKE